MIVVIAIVTTLIYGTLIGWILHWVLHQRWAGPFYRGHMNHHTKQYPPSDLLSHSYRSAGKDDSAIIFTPAVIVAFSVYIFALIKLGASGWAISLVLIEAAIVGALHDLIHTQTHLVSSYLDRWSWFQKLRALHFVHHFHMNKNLGIIWFGWDRLFRTFRKDSSQ